MNALITFYEMSLNFTLIGIDPTVNCAINNLINGYDWQYEIIPLKGMEFIEGAPLWSSVLHAHYK